MAIRIGLLFGLFSLAFGTSAQSLKPKIPNNIYGLPVVEDVDTYKEIVKADAENILLDMREVTPDAQFHVKYATSDNIAQRPLYKSQDVFMRKPAALALKKAHELLKEKGYGLRFTDGYRPYDISVYFFVTIMDTTFVPHPKYGSRHNRGMAIDLTLFHLDTGEPAEMPSAIDETTERSYHNYMDTSPAALKHRKLLRETLESVGFEPYPYEWWHYDFKGWESCESYNLWHNEIRKANRELNDKDNNFKEQVIFKSLDFHSELLNESRTLFISLPKHYEKGKASYPVLYVLDGNWQQEMVAGITRALASQGEVIPEMIVIGIGSKNRMKDFVFNETSHLNDNIFGEQGGRAALFLKSIVGEIIPYVEKNYRTNNFKLLHGHSLGGYFTTNIFLNQPRLFNGYFAISPSLQMNDFQWMDQLEKKLESTDHKRIFFQMSLGNEGDEPYFKAWDRLTKALDQGKDKLGDWNHNVYLDNNHGSIPIIATYDGLRNIFRNYNFELVKGEFYGASTFDEAEMHYRELSRKYNYSVAIPLSIVLNRLNAMMQKGEVSEALAKLDRQIALHPNIAFLYLLKAEGVLQLEGMPAAKEWIQKALSIATPDERIVIQQILEQRIGKQ